VHYIKVVLDELLPGNFRNDIVAPRGVKGVQSQFDAIDALALGHYTLLLYSKRASTKYHKLFDQGNKPSRWDTFWLGTNRPTMRYELFGVLPTSGPRPLATDQPMPAPADEFERTFEVWFT
jgi:adenine-specific DNA-methyltransferase